MRRFWLALLLVLTLGVPARAAVAVDASSPIRFTGTPANGGTIVSASFTAPANSLIVCVITGDGDTSTHGAVTRTVTDSGGLTWTNQVTRAVNETTDGGMSQIATAIQTTSAARTVTITESHSLQTTTGLRVSVKIYVFTGADIAGTPVDTVTASNEGGSATNNLTTTSVTPGANGMLVVGGTDWVALGVPASSDLTADAADYAGAISVISGTKAVSSGVGATANLDAAGTAAAQWKWCQIVVRESGGEGGGTPSGHKTLTGAGR